MKDFLSLSCSIETNCRPISCEQPQMMTSLPAGSISAYENMVHLSAHHQKSMPHRYQQSPVFKRKSANRHSSSSRYVHSHSHPTREEHHSHQTLRHKSSEDAKTSDAADSKVHLLSNLPWRNTDTSVSEPNVDTAMGASERPRHFHGSVEILQESLNNHENHKLLPSSPRHRHKRSAKTTVETTGAKPAQDHHCETIFCFDEDEFTLPVNTEQNVEASPTFSPIDTPTTPLVDNFFNPEDDLNNNVPLHEKPTFTTSPSTETLKNYDIDDELTTLDLGCGSLGRRSSDSSISSTDTVT